MARAGTVRIGISGWTYRAVARRVLSEGPAAEARTGIRHQPVQLAGDQRHVLRHAAAGRVRRLGGSCAGRVRVRGEGAALHHPHQAAARRGDAAGELHCLGPAAAWSETGADPVAVPTAFPLRCRTHRGVPEAAAARHRGGRGLRTRARRLAEGPRLAEGRCRTGRCGTRSKSATRPSAPGVHRPAAQIRCGAGMRRHGGMAAADGPDLGLRLLPAARLGGAVCQRL